MAKAVVALYPSRIMVSRTTQRPGTPLALSIRFAAAHEEAIESFTAVASTLVPILLPP
jgi:hypothetical protein